MPALFPNNNFDPRHPTNTINQTTIRLLLALLAAVPAARADIIQWDESIVTDPGRAFNPSKPASFDDGGAYVALLGPAVIGGSSGSSLSAFYAESKEDVARFLEVNVAASVHSLAYSADLSFGFSDFFSSSEQDIMFVVNARRDFGRLTQVPVGMTANFTNEINLMKQTYRGPSLYQAISNRFGSHFISGYKSAARLALMYKFHFASRAQARQFRSSLGVSGGVYDINAAATSAFSQSNSSIALEFRLDTLGRGAPPALWPSNAITSLPDFLVFGQRVEDYWRGLHETNGVPTEYIAEPIENLPGFCQLTDCYSPSNVFNTPYELFMTVHGKLKTWHNRLLYWATDSRHMSWMNSTGQTMVRALERDAFRELSALEAKARNHFERGTPLVVEDNTLNFLQNFDRIPQPSISGSFAGGDPPPSDSGKIGWIVCGPKNLTRNDRPPFVALNLYTDGQPAGNDPIPIYYSSTAFVSNLNYQADIQPHNRDWLALIISRLVGSPTWAALQAAEQECQIGFFFVLVPSTIDADRHSLALLDDAQSIVDDVPYRTSNNTLCTTAVGPVDLNAGMRSPPVGIFDTRTTYTFSITNSGLGPSYGNVATLPIAPGMQPLAASGSQGQAVTTNGVLVVTNGFVLYEVGPLAFGNSATVQLDLVSLCTGMLTFVMPANVTVGDGLTDSDLSNNSVFPASLTVLAPRLELTRSVSNIELSWVSETGRLNLESANALGNPFSWQPVPDAPSAARSIRTLHLPAAGPRKFFRLSAQMQ